MRIVLSLVLVAVMACMAQAQPPWAGQGKFGMGPGKFGDPVQITKMRQRTREALIDQNKPEVTERPGPPPWAGRGMMRGPRGPQAPFLGRGSIGQKSRVELRGSGPKGKISDNHPGYHRGKVGQYHGNKYRGKESVKKQKYRGYHKSIRKCPCCGQDYPRDKN